MPAAFSFWKWTAFVLGFCLVFSGPAWADEKKKEDGNSGGGILGSMLGGAIRQGLGLSSGDFVEFSLSRIRIINARMAAPKMTEETSADTTFLQVDEITIEYSPLEVINARILRRVIIDRPQLWVSQFTRKMEAPVDEKKPDARSQGSKPVQGDTLKLTIQRLELKNVEVYIDTLRSRGLNIPLRFAQKDPLVLEKLSIDELFKHPETEKVVTVDANQVIIHSAYGPMAPLLTVGQLRLAFTWHGLANRELESVTFSDPALYIGDDWFLLREEFNKAASNTEASPTEAKAKIAEENFIVKKFKIEHLKMTLSSFGVQRLELPFSFGYEAENVGLDQNGRFFLTSQLKIDQTNLQMPQYNLSVIGLQGDLKFNWPAAPTTPDNIVPTLKAASLKIRDFELTNPWASLTFMTDPFKKINGLSDKPTSKMYLGFGSEFAGGYLNGYLESDYSRNWDANITGTGVSIQSINAFRAQPIQGTFDFKLVGRGNGGRLDDCTVSLVNSRGVQLNLKVSGDINEFFKDLSIPQPKKEPTVDLKESIGKIITEQRLNSGQIQKLKSLHLVGENKSGYLEARVSSVDTQYPKATALIEAENADRKAIYEIVSERDQKPMEQVEQEYADIWQQLAFPSELIESPTRGWVAK